MVRVTNTGSLMRRLVRAAADRPVWSWLAMPLLALAVYTGIFNVQIQPPLWALLAPLWACAVAADLHSTYRFGGNAVRHELNPVLSWSMGRLGMKRALILHLTMYVAILTALPAGLEFAGAYNGAVHDTHHLLGIILPFMAGGHVWCAGTNTRLYRRLDA